MPASRFDKRLAQFGNMNREMREFAYEDENEEFGKIAKAFEKLVLKISQCYASESLSAEEAKNLVKAYTNVSDKISDYEAELDEEKDRNTIDLLNKYRYILGKDVAAFNNYINSSEGVSKQPKRIEEIYEDSRADHITVDDMSKLDSIGARQSKRLRVDVKRNNETVKGYFTESVKEKSYGDTLAEIRKELKQKYGKRAAFLDNPDVLRGVEQVLGSEAAETDKTLEMLEMEGSMDFDCGYKAAISSLDNYTERLGCFKSVNSPVKFKILNEYMAKAIRLGVHKSAMAQQEINPEARIDRRNSAMSMVAGLLGCEDTIAHSENLTLEVPDGIGGIRKVHGTVMDPANGTDTNRMDSKDNFMKISLESVENNPALTKQIADLQVIDYICGNSDRHGGNMLYDVDENGRLRGIKGIDNDSSFGSKYDGMSNFSCPIKLMRIIPKSTADRIMKIDEKAFELSLVAYDLTPKEIEKATNRLNEIKNAIRTSRNHYKDSVEGYLDDDIPRVVEDEKLGEYSFCSQLTKESNADKKIKGNYFGTLFGKCNVMHASKKAREFKLSEAKKEYNSLFSDDYVEMAERMDNTVNLDRKIFGGSTNYTEMRNSMKKVRELMSGFKTPFFEEAIDEENQNDIDADKKDYELSASADRLRSRVTEAIEKTEKYINGKKDDAESNREGTRPYKRLQCAKKNLELLKKLKGRFEKIDKDLADRFEASSYEREHRAENVLTNDRVIEESKAKVKNIENAEKDRKIDKHIDTLNSRLNEQKAQKKDLDSVYTALDIKILQGFKDAAHGLKNNEANTISFKKAYAACIVKDMLNTKTQALKGDNKAAAKLAGFGDINIDNIDNLDNLDKCLDDITKSNAFEKAYAKNTFRPDRNDCLKYAENRNNNYIRNISDRFIEQNGAKPAKQAKAKPVNNAKLN